MINIIVIKGVMIIALVILIVLLVLLWGFLNKNDEDYDHMWDRWKNH